MNKLIYMSIHLPGHTECILIDFMELWTGSGDFCSWQRRYSREIILLPTVIIFRFGFVPSGKVSLKRYLVINFT